jgi:hypothetical protein
MIGSFWSFLLDENNRAILAWLGSGLVVVVGALWTVFKFVFRRPTVKPEPAPTILATHGSIVAGRDIRDSKIDAN